ncbi:hypothetical protein B0H19DRAFT_1245761 [Mycena capillaripes]|nr:hypothetical protein B0H19DRAFT_1245761 [Mycena capillaripes]
MPPPPIHQFIKCPGKDDEHPCGEWIPSKLVCRGSKVSYHAGLEYQVHNCGYFRWLAPELLAAAERRAKGAPAGGAPPLFTHTNMTLVTPECAFSSTSPPSPPSSQLVPSTQSKKAKCASKPCTRLAGASACTYKMCKQCCERQNKGCQVLGHRKQQSIVPLPSTSTASGDPSALARPTPMFSYADPLPVEALPPKLYMDTEWAHRYNKNHEAQEWRMERRKQDLMYKRQVRFCFWGEDGVEPKMFRQQGLKTMQLNMASHSDLLRKMKLAATDEIGVYDFDGRCWDREDVNHVRDIVAHEVLLVRRFGVTDCPHLDEYIAKHAPKPVATRRALLAAPTHKQKRARSSSSELDRRPSKISQISLPSSSPSSPPSPILVLSPPASSTSQSSSPTPLPRYPSVEPAS